MKISNTKIIEIFTDGTINFSYTGLKSTKQIILYEKDTKTFFFHKKPTKQKLLYNLPRNSYKLKYKF